MTNEIKHSSPDNEIDANRQELYERYEELSTQC